MIIEFHPEASSAYNNSASDLIKVLKHKSPAPPKASNIDPDLHITASIDASDIIGEITLGSSDQLGNKLERWVSREGQLIGIDRAQYGAFTAFCSKLSRTKTTKEYLSQEFVENTVFDWLTAGENRQEPFSDAFLKAANSALIQATYWIPIARLRIGAPIQLGRVVFQRITRSMMDTYAQDWKANAPEEAHEGIDTLLDRKRKQLQGYTAGTVNVLAEPIYGRQVARDAAEEALELLRLFDVSSMEPSRTSSAVLLGGEISGSQPSFILNGHAIEEWQDRSIFPGTIDTTFDIAAIENAMQAGLGRVNQILSASVRTEFEQSLIEAVLLYSRVSISYRLDDKLVYALVALESMFLKNQSEPIQQNLGERIALFIGKTLEERQDILKNIRSIYSLRSQLIHHGKKVQDTDEIPKFFLNSWVTLILLIGNSSEFQTKSDLLDALDAQKLS